MARAQLTEYDFNRKEDDELLVLVGRQLLRRALESARYELEQMHFESQKNGEAPGRVLVDRKAVEAHLRQFAMRELEAGVDAEI